MANPRTVLTGSTEEKNLIAVAKMLEAISPNDYRYEVETCYFDFGQNWTWTTIIAHDDGERGVLESWQAINPRDWEDIITADSIAELSAVTERITNGAFWSDKVWSDKAKRGE